jgi:hypothetical protein
MGSYLYASPNFWSGVARLLDFGNTYDQYNHLQTGQEADSIGIFMDWEQVGQDLWVTFENQDAGISHKRVNDCDGAQLVGR